MLLHKWPERWKSLVRSNNATGCRRIDCCVHGLRERFPCIKTKQSSMQPGKGLELPGNPKNRRQLLQVKKMTVDKHEAANRVPKRTHTHLLIPKQQAPKTHLFSLPPASPLSPILYAFNLHQTYVFCLHPDRWPESSPYIEPRNKEEFIAEA